MLGVRLNEELESRLSALASKTKRSKSYIAKEALIRYIEEEESRSNENLETLARWEYFQETGESVSNDTVVDWLNTWGTEKEKSCPVK